MLKQVVVEVILEMNNSVSRSVLRFTETPDLNMQAVAGMATTTILKGLGWMMSVQDLIVVGVAWSDKDELS